MEEDVCKLHGWDLCEGEGTCGGRLSSCTVDSIVRLLRDDAWAATFQSLGQYRRAVVDAITQANASLEARAGTTNNGGSGE